MIDNKAALTAASLGATWRTRYYAVRAKRLLEENQQGRVQFKYCPTKDMVADALTKLATANVIQVLVNAMDGRLPTRTVAHRTSVTPGLANRGDIAGDVQCTTIVVQTSICQTRSTSTSASLPISRGATTISIFMFAVTGLVQVTSPPTLIMSCRLYALSKATLIQLSLLETAWTGKSLTILRNWLLILPCENNTSQGFKTIAVKLSRV